MDKFHFRPIHSTSFSPKINTVANSQTETNKTNSFAGTLQTVLQNQEQLVVSKHAKIRLQERGITISDSKWSEIAQKVADSKLKGVKEALVLLNDAALIISAKNNTVITAMNREEAKSQIFTNINGTIVMD